MLLTDWAVAVRTLSASGASDKAAEVATSRVKASSGVDVAPAPIRPIQGDGCPKVSISQFGGISGTDCSAALQRAIDHVEATGGYDLRDSTGAIEFGPGVWYINRILISKFGVRFVGAGKRATLLANKHPTEPMVLIRQGDRSVTHVIADISFENLQFRNTVHRADGAGFLIQGSAAERLLFSSVDFVSSALAPDRNRTPLKCDFIRTDTFESRWRDCNFWGILGCAIEIPDGPQSDTVMFDHCVWSYCTIAGAFGLGNRSGINGLYFQSCKVIGNQGGSYVAAGNDNFAHTTSVGTSVGIRIRVANPTNFRVNRAVVIGQSAINAQYAFVRSVSGDTITLDRSVKVNDGDDIVHGQLGFVFGHTLSPRVQSSQFEGCDVGLYVIDGRMITLDSTVAVSCARALLLNSEFRSLRLSMCIGATIGTMKNGVAWQFITILNVAGSTNVIELDETSAEGSGYYDGTPQSLVVNRSRYSIRISFLNRSTCSVRADQTASDSAVTCLLVSPRLM